MKYTVVFLYGAGTEQAKLKCHSTYICVYVSIKNQYLTIF